jgi:hypothetical protein
MSLNSKNKHFDHKDTNSKEKIISSKSHVFPNNNEERNYETIRKQIIQDFQYLLENYNENPDNKENADRIDFLNRKIKYVYDLDRVYKKILELNKNIRLQHEGLTTKKNEYNPLREYLIGMGSIVDITGTYFDNNYKLRKERIKSYRVFNRLKKHIIGDNKKKQSKSLRKLNDLDIVRIKRFSSIGNILNSQSNDKQKTSNKISELIDRDSTKIKK